MSGVRGAAIRGAANANHTLSVVRKLGVDTSPMTVATAITITLIFVITVYEVKHSL
jgi:hypothetical protein